MTTNKMKMTTTTTKMQKTKTKANVLIAVNAGVVSGVSGVVVVVLA